jgi:microtubule-associated protein, RP/EB family
VTDAVGQVMVAQQQQPPALSPILEASDERPRHEAAHKRKSISNLEEFGMAAARPRLSDITDVQLCGSPLTSFI